MAFDIRISRATLLVFVMLVIGYIIALFSLMDDAPKINNALSNKLEGLSHELYSLRREVGEKDRSIKQLNAKLKSYKNDADSGGVDSESDSKENAIIKAIERSKENTPDDGDSRLYSLFKTNRVVRQGVIVLGMHRSGTSILGGLLNKMGLKTGGPLIRPGSDNEKGFFERIDAVLQNDNFLNRQNAYYGFNLYKYSSLQGLKSYFTDPKPNFFNEGKRALEFLNNPNNYPWMLKDPRLCVTFRTWLPLLNFVPAIIYTFRHPYDVALSLNTRYERFKIARGLKLWYIHNKLAIRQSADLCRVVTSHSRLMKEPNSEMRRIRDDLLACGVPVPQYLTKAQVEEFVDPKLQHGKNSLKENPCVNDIKNVKPPDTWPTSDDKHIALYREVMRVYCALEDGSAYDPKFKWDESIEDHDPW